jgi:hypothetical protein
VFKIVFDSIHQANAVLPSLGIGQTVFVGSSAYTVKDMEGKVLARKNYVEPCPVVAPEAFIRAGKLRGQMSFVRKAV